MRGFIAVWLALIALIPVAHGKSHIWQNGQITSHKTLSVPGHNSNHVHLYGVTSGGERYMVILGRPLQVNLNADVKFSPGRKHVRILDSDGRQRKGAVLEKVAVAGRH
jgi:hypothetical protein